MYVCACVCVCVCVFITESPPPARSPPPPPTVSSFILRSVAIILFLNEFGGLDDAAEQANRLVCRICDAFID